MIWLVILLGYTAGPDNVIANTPDARNVPL